MYNWNYKKSKGFSIIELLVVVAVIGILVGITVISYVNIPKRARDSTRVEGIAAIAKALDLYYIDNGKFPSGKCTTGCTINSSWSTTNDSSWANLEAALVPEYISSLPKDPKPTMGSSPLSGSNYGYAYFSNSGGLYCGSPANQMYILVYNFESTPNVNTFNGACTTSALGPYSNRSNYRVVEGGS